MVTKRRVLIVEDLESWQSQLKKLADRALQGHEVAYEIDVVETLDAAQAYFDDTDPQHVSVMLLDLNLTAETTDTTEGFALLDALKAKHLKQPNTIVVSAEDGQMHPVNSLARYGAMAYVPKPDIARNVADFVTLLDVAVAYHEAQRLLEGWQWAKVQMAQAKWDNIQERATDLVFPAIFPQDIRHAVAERSDALTGLPSSDWTQSFVRELLSSDVAWGSLYVRVLGLEDFARARQATDEDEVHRLLATMLREIVDESKLPERFAGRWRGGYLLVLEQAKIDAMQARLQAAFAERCAPYYNIEDRTRGFMLIDVNGIERKVPLLTLEIKPFSYDAKARETYSVLDVMNG